ncbi:GntR family transcriptional regulator [Pelagibacterium lentulum]|uniref:GntR family transcriptional regulator n=1 Tax=Pelagibacterium lentulum TaxID=2029865 RepID=A0A916R8M2_9HYPH|nr:GntR family transcriptional regulator [Pelagibacterium lentulum]GGA44286.1 GntR family transcriptional regulator [Pelagibacterium lentulum]
MEPKPLTRTGTTVEEMVQAISDAIVSGQYLPGDKLDEIGVGKRFGVSRTPVREALSQLAAIGLVERRPNRGAVVTKVSNEKLATMFETLAELEAVCARLAAERMSIGERQELEQAHQHSVALVRAGSLGPYEAFNARFHQMIFDGARNLHLVELTTLTRSRLAPFRRALFRLPSRLAISFDEHADIVTAIMQGDGPGAERAMREHILVLDDPSVRLTSMTR